MTENQLSAQGEQRRDEILTLVLRESARLRQRRKRRLRVCSAAAIALIAAGAVWIYWPPAEPAAEQNQVRRPSERAFPSPLVFDVEGYLATNTVGDLAPYLVETREEIPPGILLDDSELLIALANNGRVEGIVRVGGDTWLTSELESRWRGGR